MVQSKKPEGNPSKKGWHRWSYHGVPKGTNGRGWKAGEPFGAWVHFENRRSHVCREKMSNSALQCEHCARGLIPDWRGYVPWYDEEYVRRFSLITYPYYESVCEIDHLAHIVLKRGKEATDPVVIRAEAWTTKSLPYNTERAEPVDLGPFLVNTLWKDEKLKQWDANQNYGTAFNQILVNAAEVQAVIESGVDPMNAAAMARADKVARDATNAEFVNRLRTDGGHHANGNGKKKPAG